MKLGFDTRNGIEAIIKKEVGIAKTSSSRGRSLLEADRRRLDESIPHDAHRGLRMLSSDCSQGLLDLDIDCVVDTSANEFFCAQMLDIRLDANKLVELVEPIVGELVNDDNTGTFDKVAQPLLELEKRLPGVSDIAGRTVTLLDVAEIFVGTKSGAPTVRAVLNIYRGLKSLADQFKDIDPNGILLADFCRFKPGQGMECKGGAFDFGNDDGSRRLIEMHEEMEEVFPLYDSSGLPMSASQHRFLPSGKCTPTFSQDNDCVGNCKGCTGKVAKAKCTARKLKCKGSAAGISFPFMKGK